MTISINSIGNYNPYTSRVGETTAARKTAQVKPVESEVKINKMAKQNAISTREKEFFAQLYPENSAAIMDYHYYQRTGTMSGVAVGSLLDRRG
jgi:hypothetical protein